MLMYFIAYLGGSVFLLSSIFGLNAWARELGKKEPYRWDGGILNDAGLYRNSIACVFWPVAASCAIFGFLGKSVARISKRRSLAAEERKKWLEAPLP